ncbi:MAG: ATP-dependent DNA helicase RecG [Syntrophomonadaceae bacterium]
MNQLWNDIQFIKGVGPQRSTLLAKLGIRTVEDLLWHVPRSYLNCSEVDKIDRLEDGGPACIRGRVLATRLMKTRRGLQIFKALVEDESGHITAVWFNQAFLSRQILAGQEIFLKGKVQAAGLTREMSVSEYYTISEQDDDHSILPVYPLVEGLNQKALRGMVQYALTNCLANYFDIVPAGIRQNLGLCDMAFALSNIHFPASRESFFAARRRLAFEELFRFKLRMAWEKSRKNDCAGSITQRPSTDLIRQVTEGLPYRLTSAQLRVMHEIFADLEKPQTMNRLLQGDVGSGKTVVAALAMAHTVSSGYQAAMMVPTEILAEQHYTAIKKIFASTGTIIARLTGSTNARERKSILSATAAGEIDIVVGTQALIQSQINFGKLGLAVIDEQHRFGVRQRAVLGSKGEATDTLVMTATPIPRTLALVLYGNLNVSVIDELPPGRQAVKTKFLPPDLRYEACRFIEQRVAKGDQGYFVCPVIEESEKQDLQAAQSLYEELTMKVFPQLRIGLLHGKMKSAAKEQVMQLFKAGDIDLLVTTTVVEVGVDVGNANIMVIEQAERFGLSQLHQLRGRVGRGSKQAYCFLIATPRSDEAKRRLRAMEKSNDGFELANEDLNIRGPGDFWGVRQHGLDEFKVADLYRDQNLLTLASDAVNDFDLALLNHEPLRSYILGRPGQDIAVN